MGTSNKNIHRIIYFFLYLYLRVCFQERWFKDGSGMVEFVKRWGGPGRLRIQVANPWIQEARRFAMVTIMEDFMARKLKQAIDQSHRLPDDYFERLEKEMNERRRQYSQTEALKKLHLWH